MRRKNQCYIYADGPFVKAVCGRRDVTKNCLHFEPNRNLEHECAYHHPLGGCLDSTARNEAGFRLVNKLRKLYGVDE